MGKFNNLLNMENLKQLFVDIKDVKGKYDKIREKNRFNVFTALHKEHDEVNLHSRFISYLLSSNSGHRMNEIFCEIFVRKILKLGDSFFDLQDYEVLPNEKIKSEYKEIDILIINKKTRQAIIIENKIFANDSNRKEEKKKDDGYDGQLERYYNTIRKGIDKDGNEIFDFQCNTIFIYYLTMFKDKQPSKESIGELENVNVIYYGNEIRNWLVKCVQIIPKEKALVAETIQQYLNLINKMTHNDSSIDERKSLKNKMANNWKTTKYLIDNFKHVKWHTVEEFWTILRNELKKYYNNVDFYTDENDEFINTITAITHANKDINHGVQFNLSNGKRAFISGLGKLSWGIIEPKNWKNFKDEILEDIDFSNFSTENTYRLIDKKNIEKAVEVILNEISQEQKDNFKNMMMD